MAKVHEGEFVLGRIMSINMIVNTNIPGSLEQNKDSLALVSLHHGLEVLERSGLDLRRDGQGVAGASAGDRGGGGDILPRLGDGCEDHCL